MGLKASSLLFLLLVSLTNPVAAQVLTPLYSFTGGGDGANPFADLALAGNTLYGVTEEGGVPGYGAIFRINTDGTGFTNLHSFVRGAYNSSFRYTNSEGVHPIAALLVHGDTLYGTARGGGSSGLGTVFAIHTDGSGFTNLYTFSGSDGGDPETALVLSGDTLYGATLDIGTSGGGKLFSIKTNGTGYTILHSFSGADGEYPGSSLFLSGDMLYGTASDGGSGNSGVVFGMHLDGSGFTNIYSFSPLIYSSGDYTNADGGYPYSGVILSGNTLYGTANVGGPAGRGTVFKVNTDGSGFSTLHRFTYGTGPFYTNSDGAFPQGDLVMSGNMLYGTTYYGGLPGNGTIFAVDTDGVGFASIYQFTGTPPPGYTNADGALLYAGLIASGDALYGTALSGGSADFGTIFRLLPNLVPAPQLTIIPAGDSVVLTWPTNKIEFTLQTTANLASPVSWTDVSPLPITVDGQNVVTNRMVDSQQFYRLRQ
jgi:uncharacterized repeat protein (TIGR03803 family)